MLRRLVVVVITCSLPLLFNRGVNRKEVQRTTNEVGAKSSLIVAIKCGIIQTFAGLNGGFSVARRAISMRIRP